MVRTALQTDIYLRILLAACGHRLLNCPPEVKSPCGGGLSSFSSTGTTGEKEVLEASNLTTKPAGGGYLLQTGASLVVWCGSNTVNTPPSFPGQRSIFRHNYLFTWWTRVSIY
jgi:hypothetical protein